MEVFSETQKKQKTFLPLDRSLQRWSFHFSPGFFPSTKIEFSAETSRINWGNMAHRSTWLVGCKQKWSSKLLSNQLIISRNKQAEKCPALRNWKSIWTIWSHVIVPQAGEGEAAKKMFHLKINSTTLTRKHFTIGSYFSLRRKIEGTELILKRVEHEIAEKWTSFDNISVLANEGKIMTKTFTLPSRLTSTSPTCHRHELFIVLFSPPAHPWTVLM